MGDEIMTKDGELQKTIKAFDREYVKREFWAVGILNTVEGIKKEFPIQVFPVSTEEMEKLEYGKLLKNAKLIAEKYQPVLEWFLKNFGE